MPGINICQPYQRRFGGSAGTAVGAGAGAAPAGATVGAGAGSARAENAPRAIAAESPRGPIHRERERVFVPWIIQARRHRCQGLAAVTLSSSFVDAEPARDLRPRRSAGGWRRKPLGPTNHL